MVMAAFNDASSSVMGWLMPFVMVHVNVKSCRDDDVVRMLVVE